MKKNTQDWYLEHAGSDLQYFHYDQPFITETGELLPELTIGYHTYGSLNEKRDNVVWVCHALTANSDPIDWWTGVVGAACVINPEQHFIVCANVIGSNYGTTNPLHINPKTGKPYGRSFPSVTLRDWARAHHLLREHLKLEQVDLCIGGSCGGNQALEFHLLQPKVTKRIAVLACSARETPWGIAIHEAQRMAIEVDSTWQIPEFGQGSAGVQAARGMALTGYRNYESYARTQVDDKEILDNFRAASYIRYQGAKLDKRFHALPYWYLTKVLDTHHIGRNRGPIDKVLNSIKIPALIISIDSDYLIPVAEQTIIATHIPNSQHEIISSPFGHDGFLVEHERIGFLLAEWMG